MPTNPTDVVNPGFTVNALTPIVLTLDPVRGENGEEGPPGQGMNWRGEWQTGVAYNAYDAVSRNGASYIAEVNNTSVDPATDNGSVWGLLSAPGAVGPPGPAGAQYRGPWVSTTSYVKNDLVTQLGTTYIAVSPSTNVNPSTDGGTHWQVFAASGSGGDMYKATYDTNNDGIVDTAAVAAAVPYAGVTGKPATFPSDWSTTANKPATFPGDWNTTANKPSSFPPNVHGASHVSTGGDAIPAASTSAGGLLKPLTGLATDYVGGDNACHSVSSLPLASPTQNGLLKQVSGNTTDFVDGTNNCQPIAPQIWSVRLRSFNAVSNPNFEVDQRNVGNAIANPVDNNWFQDRWSIRKIGTMVVSIGQQSVGSAAPILLPGTNFAITKAFSRITLTTAEASLATGDYLCLQQVIEGATLRELISDVHSLQILVRSSVAGLICGIVLNSSDNSLSLTQSATITSANTWTLLTFPNLPVFPTGGGNWNILPGNYGLRLQVSLACGSANISSSNGAWISKNCFGAVGQSNFAASPINSTFDIAFVQHEPGPVCSTLMDKPFTQNYDECLRYYQKTYSYGNAAGTVTASGIRAAIVLSAATAAYGPFSFIKPMAKIPTLTLYNHANGAANSIRDNLGTDHASAAAGNLSDNGFSTLTFTTATSGATPVYAHYTADTGW